MTAINLNLRGLGPSATLAINERSAAMVRRGETVYRLGLGQSPFPVPDIVVDALRAQASEKDYLPVRGLPALREAVARYHQRAGVDCAADDVLIGPGSKELLFLVQLAGAYELVLPSPSWVSYAPQAQIIGRPVAWLPTTTTTGWRLDPAALADHCARDPTCPRLLILNYPNNPAGTTYCESALRDIAHVCRRYRVVVVADEIYGELHHTGGHVSLARFYPEGTIVSSGLSKWCGAGGWRLGTLVFPRGLRTLMDAMSVIASETFTSTSAPIQYAAVRAFEGGSDIDEYLAASRRVLKALGVHVAATLRASGVVVPEPEGGFYVFPDFGAHRAQLDARGIRTSAHLAEAALDATGVAFLPGSHFGRSEGELTARLAYVDFDGAGALRAMAGELDEAWLRTHCGRVTTAIDRLCDWVRGSV